PRSDLSDGRDGVQAVLARTHLPRCDCDGPARRFGPGDGAAARRRAAGRDQLPPRRSGRPRAARASHRRQAPRRARLSAAMSPILRLAAIGRRAGKRLGAAIRLRSIRIRLIVSFGALLAIGALNVLTYYHAATRRAEVFEEVRRAVERQTLSLEALHQLESTHREITLLSGVIGVEGPPPGDGERERFRGQTDSILGLLDRLHELSSPDERVAVDQLRSKAATLMERWREFHDSRGIDPVRALAVSVAVHPLATELINHDVPAAVEREKARVAQISEA